MTDPTSHGPYTNANREVPESVQADVLYQNIVQQADSESARGRTASAVVARGALVLSLLSRQAIAARAEAQCAELRILLGEAQSGDSSRLQRWLRIHAAEYTAAEYTTECSPADLSAGDLLPGGLNDWQSLLAPARARLHEQAEKLRGGSAQARVRQVRQSGETSSRNAEKHGVAEVARTFDGSSSSNETLGEFRYGKRSCGKRSEDQKGEEDTDGGASSHIEEQQLQAERGEGKRAGGTDGGASGHIEEQQLIKERQLQHQRQMRVWRVRGALLSMVAHGGLLLLLAWMTLRLPPPPASLELQATPVEWLPQALEVSQPMELSSPEQPTENSATQESFDVSQALSQVSSDIGSTLTELAAPLASGLPSQNLLSAHSDALKLIQSSTTFFGASASGNCFCYVIDGSGSMRNGPWEAARFELLKSLASLTEKQRFYIIFFNRELSAIPLPGERDPAPAALYATRENLAHTRRWLDTLRIGIGAPPNDALAMAIDKEPDAIYLLTDGVTSVDVAKFLRERNRISDFIAGEQIRVPVHTIAFYSLDGQAMLKQLAAENAGKFTYVPDPRR